MDSGDDEGLETITTDHLNSFWNINCCLQQIQNTLTGHHREQSAKFRIYFDDDY